ncbi:MAG: P-type conjugative transfer protein TrbG [Desulfocapsaceae bacterium]|nr:P-type conjugative transfer protein TrbG [Desulfocapsaceae bacterium]
MKKRLLYLALILSVSPPAISAASAPASPHSVTEYLDKTEVPLTEKEKKTLLLSGQWSSDIQPYISSGGKLVYVHGASVPTIIAAPMQVCDVEFEPGEKINEIVVGDSARWMVESGMAGAATHIFIKPVDAGLESSAIITTDRRVYHLRLISQRTGYTPYVGFVYNDDLKRMAKQEKEEKEKDREWQSTSDAEGHAVDLSKLNFNYSVDGSTSWKPDRVYDDGQKTYIRLPQSAKNGDMPVLLIRKGKKDLLVNYRVKHLTMMVDGLFDTIALIDGVGSDQESVEIRREKP